MIRGVMLQRIVVAPYLIREDGDGGIVEVFEDEELEERGERLTSTSGKASGELDEEEGREPWERWWERYSSGCRRASREASAEGEAVEMLILNRQSVSPG